MLSLIPKFRNKRKISALATFIQHCTEGSSQEIKQEKINKSY